MQGEPVPIVLFCGAGVLPGLAARLAATGVVIVVAEVNDVSAAIRACTVRAAKVVLLAGNDAKGAEYINALMEKVRVPVVALTQSSKAAMAAIAAGAVEALPQSTPVEQIVESLRLMSAVSVIRRQPVVERRTPPRLPTPSTPAPGHRLVVIGASTGGPAALTQLLGALPVGFSAPVLIAQHMPDDYDQPFASWLGLMTKLTVKVAEDGEEARPGTVYLARGGRDLVIVASRQLMNLQPVKKGAVPSADRLLESASRLVGVSLFGAILSGMGRDGAIGLLAMHKAGAVTVVQDVSTCVVSSMPEASLDARGASLALAPITIAEQLVSWATLGAGAVP